MRALRAKVYEAIDVYGLGYEDLVAFLPPDVLAELGITPGSPATEDPRNLGVGEDLYAPSLGQQMEGGGGNSFNPQRSYQNMEGRAQQAFGQQQALQGARQGIAQSNIPSRPGTPAPPSYDETPEEAVLRLSNTDINRMTGMGGMQGDLATDQIAQLTGVPADQVAMIKNTGDPQYLSQITTPAQRPPFEGIGIDSILPDTETQELSEFVDQGNSMTDFVTSQLGVEGSLQDYLREDEMVEAMANLGVDRNEADAEILDGQPISDDTRLLQVEAASLAGGAALGTSDPDAVQTINTTSQIQQSFDPYDPDDVKAKLGVYRTAAESFFGTDDLEEFIPQPDKALPFLVAGAALINAGHHGRSWGEALSTAFLNYATTKRKEETDYEKSILGLKLKDRQDIRTFATQLYLADRQEQNALARSMATADVKHYRVEGFNLPVPMTDSELMQNRATGQYNVLGEWKEEKLQNYTITDYKGNKRVEGLTPAAALEMKNSGLWENIVEDDQLAGAKFYNVDGVNKSLTPEEARQLQSDGTPIFLAKGNDRIKAFDTKEQRAVFIDQSILDDQKAAGTNRFVPIDEQLAIAHDEQGNPIVGNARMVFGLLNRNEVATIVTDFGTQYNNANFNRNRILTTIDEVRSILESGEVIYGSAGELTKAGSRFINELDQLDRLFSSKEKGFRFFESNKADGEYDPQTDTVLNYGTFKNRFGLGNFVDESSFGKTLLDKGLRKKEAENLIFQLALSNAMLQGQKGRDISDKDIERFLTVAGAWAVSERELLTLLDNLEFSAIDYTDKLADVNLRLSPAKMKNPDPEGEGTVNILKYHFDDIIAEDDNYIPTAGKESIGARRERLKTRRAMPGGVSEVKIEGVSESPGVGGDIKLYGELTNHQIYEEFKRRGSPDGQITPEQMAYIATVKGFFELDDPKWTEEQREKQKAAWQVIKNYVETMHRQGIRKR